MHEVTTGVWIGNAADARDPLRLHEAGIVAVVDLAREEPPAVLGREFVSVRVPLLDGAGNDPNALSLAIESVASIVRRGLPVLVACSAGASRSPAVTACALAAVRETRPDDVLRELRDAMPLDVSPGLWLDLTRAGTDG